MVFCIADLLNLFVNPKQMMPKSKIKDTVNILGITITLILLLTALVVYLFDINF